MKSIMIIVSLLAVCCVAGYAIPVEQTEYAKSGLRIEARYSTPITIRDDALRQSYESALASSSVHARWIQVVDNYGAPLIKNPYLPCTDKNAEENEIILKKWVDELHKQGTTVLSWYPLSFCHSGWEQHPQWRQEFIVPYNEPGFACCFETGYGEALINYCNWVIEKFGLDGIWFDGSAWTPIWSKPYPLSCSCESCKAKFKQDTGQSIPDKLDWNDPVFRKWVSWRYQEFGNYIGKLASAIRQKNPNAAVVINHYHRPGIPWQSAIPIDLYSADIISGSEASEPETVDLTMRLCRAYGRQQSEVWRPFDLAGSASESADALIRHALVCFAAGGHPVYGGDMSNPLMAPTAALVSPVIDSINPYADGKSISGVGMHVSQQTETFYCERGGLPFFGSLAAWTTSLGEAHIAPDYIYDTDFTPEKLAGYRVVFMPLSIALSEKQSRYVIDYVKKGGMVVCGIAAGQLDEQAQIKQKNFLGSAFGFQYERAPRDGGADTGNIELKYTGGRTVSTAGVWVPMKLVGKGWKILANANNTTAAAAKQYGKGKVVALSVDFASFAGSLVAVAGNTDLRISDAMAKSGKYSLEYTDDPVAPMTFYPDLENRFPTVGLSEYVGGEYECDLWLEKDAEVTIDIRSQEAPIEGPHLTMTGGGKAVAVNTDIGEIPADQWVHVSIKYKYADAGSQAEAEITITMPDGSKLNAKSPCITPGFKMTNWMVVYGSGTKPARFYMDNMKLTAIRPDGTSRIVLSNDFEDPDSLVKSPTEFISSVLKSIRSGISLPVNIYCPESVRAGVFQKENNRMVVHLYNTTAKISDWLRKSGPAVTVDCTFPVKSAKLALLNNKLPVNKIGNKWRIKIPSVGLYQVLEIQK